jgi:hypothetical protein
LFLLFHAVCGCGDELTTVNSKPLPHEQVGNLRQRKPPPRKGLRGYFDSVVSCCSNFGYRYNGSFSNIDILAIHKANKEDPTAPGMFGTEELRRSYDIFNKELTFSIISKDLTINNGLEGYSSLDIECFNEEDYFLLLRGFIALLEENLQERERIQGGKDDEEAERKERNNGKDSKLQGAQLWAKEGVGMISNYYKRTREAVLSFHNGSSKKSQNDPLSALFAPSYTIDPFRAFRVGGGLLMKSPNKDANLYASLSSSASATAAHTYRLPVAQFLGWNSAGTQIWARLKMAGLDVKCLFSSDLSRVILKIRCPKWRLEQMAEQMHMRLRTKNGHLKAFRVSRRDSFIPFGSQGNIFRSAERQQIIDYIIRSKIVDGGAELDSSTELGRYIVQRFPLHMYTRLQDIRHSWVTFWKKEAYGVTSEPWSLFAVSYRHTLYRCYDSCNHFFNNVLNQPLDNIAEYFGENLAFYFAFLAYYTRWLIFPMILGIILFIIQVNSHRLDHWLCVPYAIILMIWISFLLVFWRQKASTLAYRWGVLDYEVDETERPEFHGSEVIDDLTGEIRKIYPLHKRFLRYLLTTPVWSSIIILTLLIMTTVFYSQDRLYEEYSKGENLKYSPTFPHASRKLSSSSSTSSSSSSHRGDMTLSWNHLIDGDFWAVTFFYPSLYGICVSLISISFHFIARYLTEFENHPTQTTFMNRLILKVFSFEFVSIFTSLYYYAFFMNSTTNNNNNADDSYLRISVTIFSLMTVGQWWKVILDLSIPSLYHRALLYRMKSNYAMMNRKVYAVKEWTEQQRLEHQEETTGNITTTHLASQSKEDFYNEINKKLEKRIALLQQGKSKCWEEALQGRYNTFSDYTHMIIQICFILCFGAIFPLAPAIAFINNLLLIRVNALKICYTRQRPIAVKMGGIGVWSDVLQLLSVGGVLTNCALFGFVSQPLRMTLLPVVGETGIALLLFAFEQVVLLFKYWLHTSIPSIPHSVQRAQMRERKSMSRRSILKAKYHHQKSKEQKKKEKERKNSLNQQQPPSHPPLPPSAPGPSSTEGGAVLSPGDRKNSSLLQYMKRLSANIAHGIHDGYLVFSPKRDSSAVTGNQSTNDDHFLVSHQQQHQPHFISPSSVENHDHNSEYDEKTEEKQDHYGNIHTEIPFQHPHYHLYHQQQHQQQEKEEEEDGDYYHDGGREQSPLLTPRSGIPSYSPPPYEEYQNDDDEEEEEDDGYETVNTDDLPPPDESYEEEMSMMQQHQQEMLMQQMVEAEEEEYDDGLFSPLNRMKVDERSLQKKYNQFISHSFDEFQQVSHHQHQNQQQFYHINHEKKRKTSLSPNFPSRNQVKDQRKLSFNVKSKAVRDLVLQCQYQQKQQQQQQQQQQTPPKKHSLQPQKRNSSLLSYRSHGHMKEAPYNDYEEEEVDDDDDDFGLQSPMQLGVQSPPGKGHSPLFFVDKSEYHPTPMNRYSKRLPRSKDTPQSKGSSPYSQNNNKKEERGGNGSYLWNMNGSNDNQGTASSPSSYQPSPPVIYYSVPQPADQHQQVKRRGSVSPHSQHHQHNGVPVLIQNDGKRISSLTPPQQLPPKYNSPSHQATTTSSPIILNLPKLSKQTIHTKRNGQPHSGISGNSSLLKQVTTKQMPHTPQQLPSNSNNEQAKNRRISIDTLSNKIQLALSHCPPAVIASMMDAIAEERDQSLQYKRNSPLNKRKSTEANRKVLKSSKDYHHNGNNHSKSKAKPETTPIQPIHSVQQMVPFSDGTTSIISHHQQTSSVSRPLPSVPLQRTPTKISSSPLTPVSILKSGHPNSHNRGNQSKKLQLSSNSTRHLFPSEAVSPFSYISENHNRDKSPARNHSAAGDQNGEDNNECRENSPIRANLSPKQHSHQHHHYHYHDDAHFPQKKMNLVPMEMGRESDEQQQRGMNYSHSPLKENFGKSKKKQLQSVGSSTKREESRAVNAQDVRVPYNPFSFVSAIPSVLVPGASAPKNHPDYKTGTSNQHKRFERIDFE